MISIKELVILPALKRATLCRVSGHIIEVLHELEFPFDRRHAIGDHGWIVALCLYASDLPCQLEDKQYFGVFLYRARLQEDGTLKRLPDIQLSMLSLNQTLAIKGDVVYMGGHKLKNLEDADSAGEIAGYVHLLEDQATWQPLEIPVELQEGKSIDDVLIYDDKLVLVDNIMYPKYLFEYDISDPLAPVSTKTVSLPNNGTYEHIHRGAINRNWLALHSSGVGRSGTGHYLSVLKLPEYEQVLTVSVHYNEGRDLMWGAEEKGFSLKDELEKAGKKITIQDFALAGDTLLVACGHHGIASLSLADLLEEQAKMQENTINNTTIAEPSKVRRKMPERGLSRVLSKPGLQPINWFMPENFDTADKLVQLPDNRVVAVSFGETGRVLEFQILA
jgi:hypothetical protein